MLAVAEKMEQNGKPELAHRIYQHVLSQDPAHSLAQSRMELLASKHPEFSRPPASVPKRGERPVTAKEMLASVQQQPSQQPEGGNRSQERPRHLTEPDRNAETHPLAEPASAVSTHLDEPPLWAQEIRADNDASEKPPSQLPEIRPLHRTGGPSEPVAAVNQPRTESSDDWGTASLRRPPGRNQIKPRTPKLPAAGILP
jgi:hypothetical protein